MYSRSTSSTLSSNRPTLFLILPLFLILTQTTLINATGLYSSHLNVVGDHFSSLQSQISSILSLAQNKGHTDVVQLGQSAQHSLDDAISAWDKVSSVFENKPWLASDSRYRPMIDSYLSDCGKQLSDIYTSPHVKRDEQYSEPVQQTQEQYTSSKSSCDSIWDWQVPAPKPSGGYSDYYKRQVLTRRKPEQFPTDLPKCPGKETACPISANSEGFECIDTETELTSCGGCTSQNQGMNCMEIPGAMGVGCTAGKCVSGDAITLDGDSTPVQISPLVNNLFLLNFGFPRSCFQFNLDTLWPMMDAPSYVQDEHDVHRWTMLSKN